MKDSISEIAGLCAQMFRIERDQAIDGLSHVLGLVIHIVMPRAVDDEEVLFVGRCAVEQSFPVFILTGVPPAAGNDDLKREIAKWQQTAHTYHLRAENAEEQARNNFASGKIEEKKRIIALLREVGLDPDDLELCISRLE